MDGDVTQYEVDIDLTNPNTSHALVAALVGRDQRVLDVGCWTGDLGRVLARRGCRVSGVEIDPDAAATARADLAEIAELDLNAERVSDCFPAGAFDVVVLADVLEHLVDPPTLLRDVQAVLAPGGRVVASIPNVAHGSVRLALLQGRWTYTETGLLDQTHLRFFSRASLIALFGEAGLIVDELRATTADPLGVEVGVDADRLPGTAVEWVREQPDALIYQFVLAAHPAAPGEAQEPGGLIVRPAVPDEQVRVVDQHTERLAADREDRHRLLTIRDHLIGLEAATATAQTRAERVERQLKGARKRLERKNLRIQELVRRVQQLQDADDPPPAAPAGRAKRAWGRLRGSRPTEP